MREICGMWHLQAWPLELGLFLGRMVAFNQEERFRLRIELNEIEPVIWREITVPKSISLAWLHEVIQIAMGWMDMHLHQFEKDGTIYELPSEDGDGSVASIDESTVPLNRLFVSPGDTMKYTYDFGDDWEHSIELKEVLPAGSGDIVQCIGGENAGPPEDCGGAYGYMDLIEMLEAKAQGKELSDAQEEKLEWFGGAIDDLKFPAKELEGINETLQKMLEYAMPEGGLTPDGAPIPDGLFKPYELDDEEDDEDFQAFMSSMTDALDEEFGLEEDDDEEDAPRD
ncbi:MAG: plasmid pRiA4b ORF-3 family protein [Opitutales bacterium]